MVNERENLENKFIIVLLIYSISSNTFQFNLSGIKNLAKIIILDEMSFYRIPFRVKVRV